MDDRSDAALVRRALGGHREAFAELVRRHQDCAHAMVVAALSDFDLARDVVQDAFLCAYRDLRRLKDAAKFGGWLQGIVRNTARRALREVVRVRALAAEMSGMPEIEDPSPRPDEMAMKNERRRIVREALQRLGRLNREAVSLHLSGLSYAEIAGRLGVTEATVLGRLQRGRAELKKELLTMVEDAFAEERLPADFSAEIARLLEAASAPESEVAVARLAEIGRPAVDPLCEALGDPRPVVRRVAARALCRIGDTRALGPILRVLYAGDYWIGNVVFRTGRILRIPGVRDELLRLAGSGSRAERYWAIEALGSARDDDEVRERLQAIFHDGAEDTGVRCSALSALCELREDLAPGWIVEALGDPRIRRLSGWAWWIALKRGHVVPLDLCLEGLDRDVAPNGRSMAGLLALRHGDAGIAALERTLRSDSPEKREAAAVALSRKDHAEAFDALVEGLRRGGHERKWSRIVIRAVVRNYAQRFAEWLETVGPDLSESSGLAWAAAQVRLTTGRATPADLVQQGPPTLRADALRKLVAESGAAALPELRRCLAEGMPGKLSREAFWRMHDLREAAEPLVLEMLNSPQWTERKAAVSLLRRWGKLTPEQKAQAAADPHIAVRHAADWHPSYIEAARRGHPKWARKLGPHRE